MPVSRNEEIKYSYTGDVSSLQKATKDAIASLHKYEEAFRSTAKAGNMNVNAQSVSSFSKQVNTAYKSITDLYKMLQQIGQSGVTSVQGVDKAAGTMTKSFNTALEALKNMGRINDADLKRIEETLKSAATQAETIANKVRGVNTTFSALHESSEKVNSSTKSIAENTDKVTKSAKESAAVFEKLYNEQNKYNRSTPGYNTDSTFRASKSARESADVFKNSYDREFNWPGLMIRNQVAGGMGFEETIPVIQKMGIVFDSTSTSMTGFLGKATAVAAGLRTLQKVVESVVSYLKEMVTAMAKFTVAATAKSFLLPFQTLAGILSTIYDLTGGNWGQRLGEFFSEGTKGAIDMVETLNLFNVAMGDSIQKGNEFINTYSDVLGLDPTNMQQTIGIFYEMGAAVGVPADEAATLALGMEKLALNVSSLFNVDIETVADNLTSGLRGMSRAVVKYGMDIRASTVETYLNSIGITEQFETMNEASREIARYIVMVKQAADANGDFANTINSPANQLRIFKEQFIQLGRTVGTFFVNAFGTAITVINGVIMAIRLVLEELARFFGLFTGATVTGGIEDATDSAESGVSGVGDAAGSAAKKLNDMLAPFDELNILAKDLSSSGGSGGSSGISGDLIDPRLLKELEKVESTLGLINNKATKVRDRILEFLGLKYTMVLDLDTGEVISKLEVIPGEFADKLITAVQNDDWEGVGSVVGEKLNEVIALADNAITDEELSSKIIETVKKAARTANGFVETFDWFNLGKLVGDSVVLAVNSFDAFITTADFEEFGASLADLLDGFISTFAEGDTGTAIAHWFNKCVDFAIGFAYEFDFAAFGTTLATNLNNFIDNLNFENVGQVLATWLNKMVEYAAAFNETFDWTGFEAKLVLSIETFFSEFDFHKFLTTATEIINHLISALEAAVNSVDWFNVGYEIGEALKRIDWGSLLNSVAQIIIETLGGLLASLIPDLMRNLTKKALTYLTPGALNIGTTQSVGSAISDAASKKTSSSSKSTTSSGTSVFNSANKLKLPGMAVGGVVTSPTRALIGEGRYEEAVIPLGDSPQIEDMLSRFAQVSGGSNPVEVRVYIGDSEWDAFTYQSAQRGAALVGANPVREDS